MQDSTRKWIYIAPCPWYKQSAQTWITQFCLHITPCLPLLPSRRASAPFKHLAGTHFTVPRRVEGWVDLGGWLHTKIKCRLREPVTDTVTHPSTNRAQRRSTSLIETNALPLRQTTGPPSNAWFLEPTWISSQNGISIGSAIFAQLTRLPTDRHTDHATCDMYMQAMWPDNTRGLFTFYM